MPIALTRPETTVELCQDASLQAVWEQARATLATAQQSALKDKREAGESPAVTQAKQALRQTEEYMQDQMLVFTLRALPRKRLEEIRAAHPPRQGDETDEALGIDISAGVDAILSTPGFIVSVTRKNTGEPVAFDPETEWDALADEMSNGQWEAFATKVFSIHQAKVVPGFTPAAYTTPPSESASS